MLVKPGDVRTVHRGTWGIAYLHGVLSVWAPWPQLGGRRVAHHPQIDLPTRPLQLPWSPVPILYEYVCSGPQSAACRRCNLPRPRSMAGRGPPDWTGRISSSGGQRGCRRSIHLGSASITCLQSSVVPPLAVSRRRCVCWVRARHIDTRQTWCASASRRN